MIKGIIFDLDGTLIRLPINYEKIFEKLRILFDTKDEFKPLIPSIISKSNNDTVLLQNAFDIICEEETKATNNFDIIDGTVDVLNYLKNQNFELCLVTMQCKNAAKLVLDKIQISKFFTSVITRDDSNQRSEQIKKSFEKLSLIPENILMIGDRIHDVHSAKQVGCSAILFNKNKLNSFNESKVISKLSELKEIDLSM
jgi:HAD superfamily hydrolase (TIGR01549 family)